jgi:hypothetical protein
MRPIVFLDMDDVLTISREHTIYQLMDIFKSQDFDGYPELWSSLVFAEGRANLEVLDIEFSPQYVISSNWSNHLSREQMEVIFRRTGLTFVADSLHKHWTTPKGTGSARVTEIESWIDRHAQSSQPMLVLDDHESGWNLHESSLDKKGCVVLCEPWIGFIADKLLEAQKLLRAQT